MMKKNRRTRRRSSGNGVRKHLTFERLEARQLLAGDLLTPLGTAAASDGMDSSFTNIFSAFAIQQSVSGQFGVAQNHQTTCQHAASDGDLGTVSFSIGDDGSCVVGRSNGLGRIDFDGDSGLTSVQAPSPEMAPPNFDFVPLTRTTDNFEQLAPGISPVATFDSSLGGISPTGPFSEPLPTTGPADLAPFSITVATGVAATLPADEIRLEPTSRQYFLPFDHAQASETGVGVARTGLLAPHQLFGLLPAKTVRSSQAIPNAATQSTSPTPTAAEPKQRTTTVPDRQVSAVTETKQLKTSVAGFDLDAAHSFVTTDNQYRNAGGFETVAQADVLTANSASYSAIGTWLACVSPQFVLLPEQSERFEPDASNSRLAYLDGLFAGVDWDVKTSDDAGVMSRDATLFFVVLGGLQAQQPSGKLGERRGESCDRKC